MISSETVRPLDERGFNLLYLLNGPQPPVSRGHPMWICVIHWKSLGKTVLSQLQVSVRLTAPCYLSPGKENHTVGKQK